MSNALDLSKLPPPAAVETLSHNAIVAEIRTFIIASDPSLEQALDLESEPIVKLLEAFGYRELLLRGGMNDDLRAGFLAFADGADLDHNAANLGAVRLAGETDAAFRARAVLAPESWSSAGPTEGYRYFALSAHPQVADVAVSTPSAGTVRIVVLSTAADGVPSAEVLNAVNAALSGEEDRPCTDNLELVAAGVTVWNVVANLQIPGGPDAGAVVAAADAAVRKYAAERRKMNKRIVRDLVKAALIQPGVEGLTLTSPATDIAASPTVAPVLGNVTLTVTIV